MFVSDKTHELILKSKEDEIATLRSEVAFLRSIVSSYSNPMTSLGAEKTHLEANAVLSGSQEQIDLNSLPQISEDVLAERIRLLDGTY